MGPPLEPLFAEPARLGLRWFAGMAASGAEYDPEFTAADRAALDGDWSWLKSVVGPAVAGGPAALIDDDLAYVQPWGFDRPRARRRSCCYTGTATASC